MTLNILGGRDHKPHTIPKCAAALGLRGNRCWDDTPGGADSPSLLGGGN